MHKILNYLDDLPYIKTILENSFTKLMLYVGRYYNKCHVSKQMKTWLLKKNWWEYFKFLF